MSIQSAGGLKPQGLVAAGANKDGTGNGNGGMYFGSEQPMMHEPYIPPRYYPTYDLHDVPYQMPLLHFSGESLIPLKAVWAKALYAHINESKHSQN